MSDKERRRRMQQTRALVMPTQTATEIGEVVYYMGGIEPYIVYRVAEIALRYLK